MAIRGMYRLNPYLLIYRRKKRYSLYSTMKSIKPVISMSGGHFQLRWIFCSFKNISRKRYMSNCSLSIISRVWYKIRLISETRKNLPRQCPSDIFDLLYIYIYIASKVQKVMISSQNKLIFHKAERTGSQFQDKKWTKIHRLRQNFNRNSKISNAFAITLRLTRSNILLKLLSQQVQSSRSMC